MHLVWSSKWHPILILYSINKWIRKQNSSTTIGCLQRTNILLRSLSPPRACVCIFLIFFLAGARYFRLAIRCYEIPFCFSFVLVSFFFIVLHFSLFKNCFFLFHLFYSTMVYVFYSIVRHDPNFVWGSLSALILSSSTRQYFPLKPFVSDLCALREENACATVCYFLHIFTANAIKIHSGLLNFNLFFYQ